MKTLENIRVIGYGLSNYSKFTKLLQNCDIAYTYVNESVDNHRIVIIEYGRLQDFPKIPKEKKQYIVEIETNAKTIHQEFKDCMNLEKVVTLDNVELIDSYVFYCCRNLTYVELSNSVKCIGNHCFAETSIEKINIPNSVKTLGDSAFRNCQRLKQVNLGNSVKSIGDCCFEDTSIIEINIPDSTETLGNCAFRNCHWLEHINVGNSVTYIGYACFKGTALFNNSDIMVKNKNKNNNNDTFSIKEMATIDVPVDEKDTSFSVVSNDINNLMRNNETSR